MSASDGHTPRYDEGTATQTAGETPGAAVAAPTTDGWLEHRSMPREAAQRGERDASPDASTPEAVAGLLRGLEVDPAPALYDAKAFAAANAEMDRWNAEAFAAAEADLTRREGRKAEPDTVDVGWRAPGRAALERLRAETDGSRSPFPPGAYEEHYDLRGLPCPVVEDRGGVDGDPAASMSFLRGKLMGRGAYEAIAAAASEPAVAAGCAAAWLVGAADGGDAWAALHAYVSFAFPNRPRLQGGALAALQGALRRDAALLRSDDGARAEDLLRLVLPAARAVATPRTRGVEEFARAIIVAAADRVRAALPRDIHPILINEVIFAATERFAAQTRAAATAAIERERLVVAFGKGRADVAKLLAAWYRGAERRAAVPFASPAHWDMATLRRVDRRDRPRQVHVCDREGCSCSGGWLFDPYEVGALIRGASREVATEVQDLVREIEGYARDPARLRRDGADLDELRAALKERRVALLAKGIREQPTSTVDE